MILFLALLAVVCQLGVVVVAGFVASGRWWVVRDAVGPQALAVASLIAFVAMLGSLYLSEVADFRPCRLCWYQRYAMYPLGPLLAVAAWQRRWRWLVPAGFTLAGAGAVIAGYHILLERYPSLDGPVCDPTNPCTLIWVEKFGYLTIPGMALSGFAAILVLLALSRRSP